MCWNVELCSAPNGAIRRFEYNNVNAAIEPVAIGLTNPQHVSVDDTYVYYGASNIIYRVRKDNSAAPEVIGSVPSFNGFMGGDADFLYILTGGNNGNSDDIVRLSK